MILLLANRITSHIFFQGAHLLCVLEWLKLIPVTNDDAGYPSKCTSTRHETNEKTSSEGSSDENKRSASASASASPTMLTVSSTSITPAMRIFPIASFLGVYVPKEFATVYISIVAAMLYLSANVNANVNHSTTRIQNTSRHTLHGLLYLTLSFHHWMQLSHRSFSHTLYLLSIVWNCDTGALLAGRMGKMIFKSKDVVGDVMCRFHIGKRLVKFVKDISPSKSMTGFGGGIALGMWTACSLPEYMVRCSVSIASLKGTCIGIDTTSTCIDIDKYLHMDVHQIESGLLDFDMNGNGNGIMWAGSTSMSTGGRRLVVGFILSLCAIAGDLVESAVKRQAGKKDSGKMLPGHGGILDRFDSTFLAVGVYLCFLM